MPRQRNGFIDRSTAKTYQLVHTSGGDGGTEKHVFVPVNDAAAAQRHDESSASFLHESIHDAKIAGDAIDGSQWDQEYVRTEFEPGEYGCPNDGYDYSKHFKVIGGGGGVFMDGITGKPNPDAVTGSSSKRNTVRSKDGVLLRDDVAEFDKEFPEILQTTKDDIVRTQAAIREIKAERKKNKDLDEVFAALDSEGELDSSSQRDGDLDVESADDFFNEAGLSGSNDLLEDDFITTAQQICERDEVKTGPLDGIVKEYREPRLLDEQFEKFMRASEDVSNDEDGESEEFFHDSAANNVGDVDDVHAHLTNNELENLFGGEEGFLDELSNLQISETVEGDVGAEDGVEHLESNCSERRADPDRVAEYEDITNAEFERGLDGVLDSFSRVPMEEVLGSRQGVEKAFEALERNDREEVARLDKRIEEGLDEESDGHDSDLDTKFDVMYEQKGEKWDCETIVSTYSNLDNHPSVIDAPSSTKRRSVVKQPVIRLDPRTQAPEGYMPSVRANASEAAPVDFGSSRREVAQKTQARDRGESKEDKRARKAAAKEAARERRALKSEMKKAFGSESVKQNRHATAIGTSKVAMKF
ncbi:unnamed protein product [Chondrus crispus]|uniref:Protein LTV1 homolog n=1 Tax=Chondrus crispus TaxID=2769 RepID=R7QGC9_CHOCR|nr:unnamed protein product [Chondrus crispus]CDF37139.1 unnamed protein product [Chondrus crispus]|eukprot:XP_005716958.1 unnamed protein product [Chondrus crispus]